VAAALPRDTPHWSATSPVGRDPASTSSMEAKRPAKILRGSRSPLLWLSSWVSQRPNLAGMDGNRTQPGRLNSAPQTVLKTAGLPSTDVYRGPLEFGRRPLDSKMVRLCPPVFAELALSSWLSAIA
jgi:hypothetical protein